MDPSGRGPGGEQQDLLNEARGEQELLNEADQSLADDTGAGVEPAARHETAGVGSVGGASPTGVMPPEGPGHSEASLLHAEDGAATGEGREA